MAEIQSAEETKQKYISVMGNDLGSVFYALYNELVWQHVKWKEYQELFGTKPSRIDLINEAAPLFFHIVQDALWEDTLLHIARITDPPKSCGKSNLTIQSLPGLVAKELEQRINELIDDAKSKSAFCRDWRNRKLAHKDLDLVLGDKVKPLEPASRQMVKESLESISIVLNAIVKHYMDSTILFDMLSHPSGVNSLLYMLDAGTRAEKERKNRIKSGKYTESDLVPRDL